MTIHEKALQLITRVKEWPPEPTPNFHTMGVAEKCAAIAQWALEGDEDKIEYAAKTLFPTP